MRASDIFDGELYDARLALPGWDMPGFTAADWLPAVKDTRQSDSVLYPQFDDPVICVKELPAQCVYTSPKGETIVDFGQVVAGRARVTVDLPTGAAVTLEHFEAVDAKGNYFNNIDSAMGITEQKTCSFPMVRRKHLRRGSLFTDSVICVSVGWKIRLPRNLWLSFFLPKKQMPEPLNVPMQI
ncbi:family 78 glycoside hydrolase catalytic domain [Gemmiger formicilis]|nr:family 78 glycoside hydrolase catalytic domain [Gemmiger formicilis]